MRLLATKQLLQVVSPPITRRKQLRMHDALRSPLSNPGIVQPPQQAMPKFMKDKGFSLILSQLIPNESIDSHSVPKEVVIAHTVPSNRFLFKVQAGATQRNVRSTVQPSLLDEPLRIGNEAGLLSSASTQQQQQDYVPHEAILTWL